jgi:hypothetical protein
VSRTFLSSLFSFSFQPGTVVSVTCTDGIWLLAAAFDGVVRRMCGAHYILHRHTVSSPDPFLICYVPVSITCPEAVNADAGVSVEFIVFSDQQEAISGLIHSHGPVHDTLPAI